MNAYPIKEARVSNAVNVLTYITKIAAPRAPKVNAKIDALNGEISP